MSLSDLSLLKMLVLGASVLASLWTAVVVWRRPDPVLFKSCVVALGFVPVVGPLFALWVCSFPDRMHPDMQAKYRRVVNTYAVPKEAIEASVKKGEASDAT
jgi:hypothetical protein